MKLDSAKEPFEIIQAYGTPLRLIGLANIFLESGTENAGMHGHRWKWIKRDSHQFGDDEEIGDSTCDVPI